MRSLLIAALITALPVLAGPASADGMKATSQDRPEGQAHAKTKSSQLKKSSRTTKVLPQSQSSVVVSIERGVRVWRPAIPAQPAMQQVAYPDPAYAYNQAPASDGYYYGRQFPAGTGILPGIPGGFGYGYGFDGRGKPARVGSITFPNSGGPTRGGVMQTRSIMIHPPVHAPVRKVYGGHAPRYAHGGHGFGGKFGGGGGRGGKGR
jgi:hypothetical protein